MSLANAWVSDIPLMQHRAALGEGILDGCGAGFMHADVEQDPARLKVGSVITLVWGHVQILFAQAGKPGILGG